MPTTALKMSAGSKRRIVLVAACVLLDREGRVLLARRPEGRPLAGLWEFPGGKIEAGGSEPPKVAHTGRRKAYFQDAGFVETPTFSRDRLLAGNRIEGPALIEEYASTTVVSPGESVEVDPLGNLMITISGGKR